MSHLTATTLPAGRPAATRPAPRRARKFTTAVTNFAVLALAALGGVALMLVAG